jgi:flavin-dependent dehydrogenase
MSELDVAIVGGGPAGSAAAGALARRGFRVVLFERGSYDEPRVGETFGGEIGPLLAELGAADAMRDVLATQVPFVAVQSAWGSDVLEERASIVHPLGEGVHVDRARFDARLAEWARASGASVRLDAGTCVVDAGSAGTRVTPARGDAVEARVFVDASGRGAPASKSIEGSWVAWDRQVAVVARMSGADAGDASRELLVEAAEDGWWYSAPQPDGAIVVALVTDADLVPAGGRASMPERFARALAATKHTAARTARLAHGALRVVRADSGCFVSERARAVGDAEMAIDPLAGNGVARALRSALTAASAIGAGEPPPSSAARFAAYLDRRAEIYARETRWTGAPFWARRRPLAWHEAPLTLDPHTLLRAASADAAAMPRVEALIAPRAIAAVLEALSSPRPAHEAMSTLRAAAPFGDRRLLVALQELVACGAIERV